MDSDARKHFHNLVEHLRLALRDDHAAELVNDQHILFGRHFAEALNKELQNVVRRLGRVLECNSHMAEHDDDVLRHQTRFAANTTIYVFNSFLLLYLDMKTKKYVCGTKHLPFRIILLLFLRGEQSIRHVRHQRRHTIRIERVSGAQSYAQVLDGCLAQRFKGGRRRLGDTLRTGGSVDLAQIVTGHDDERRQLFVLLLLGDRLSMQFGQNWARIDKEVAQVRDGGAGDVGELLGEFAETLPIG